MYLKIIVFFFFCEILFLNSNSHCLTNLRSTALRAVMEAGFEAYQNQL
jgi:hypothetical protein